MNKNISTLLDTEKFNIETLEEIKHRVQCLIDSKNGKTFKGLGNKEKISYINKVLDDKKFPRKYRLTVEDIKDNYISFFGMDFNSSLVYNDDSNNYIRDFFDDGLLTMFKFIEKMENNSKGSLTFTRISVNIRNDIYCLVFKDDVNHFMEYEITIYKRFTTRVDDYKYYIECIRTIINKSLIEKKLSNSLLFLDDKDLIFIDDCTISDVDLTDLVKAHIYENNKSIKNKIESFLKTVFK